MLNWFGHHQLHKVYMTYCLTLPAEKYLSVTEPLEKPTFSKLPFRDYLYHLVSSRDIELIYYFVKLYFPRRNRNNMLFSRDLRTVLSHSSLYELQDPRSTIRWRIPYGNDGVFAWAIWTSRWYIAICNYLPFKAL